MNQKWSKEEDNYLITNYPNNKKELIQSVINRSWMSIQTRASRLGINRINIDINGKSNNIWNKKEIDYLESNYQKLEKDILKASLNRSWSSIQNKAFILKLKRDVANADSTNLINGSNEAYYWLGFIMADGHFNNNKQIQINLAIKDLDHLVKFAKFVDYKYELTKPNINIDYTLINEWLIDMFNIKHNKTYNPCVLNKINGDALFSLIIGFIDGDGSINKKGYLALTSHKAWLNNINFMLTEITNNGKYHCAINNSGLVVGIITRITTMKNIKLKAINLGLPILRRKWDRVRLDKLSKKEQNIKNLNDCVGLFEKGLSVKDIIEITKLSRAQIYKQKALWEKINML